MRTIKAIHTAEYEPIADLVTYRAMPTATVPMNAVDPFIFLNHHGRQIYPAHNNGLPFGPHPHRGFETLTFILEGDLMHTDSSGGESIINAGGIQWMTAGKGLVHAEISSPEFKETGGPLEILQLWINLPAKHKMTTPAYKGLQKNEIPAVTFADDKVSAHLVFGNWNGVDAALQPLTDIHLAQVNFKTDGKTEFVIARNQNIFLYIIKGELLVNGSLAKAHQLVEFDHDDDKLIIAANTDAIIYWDMPHHLVNRLLLTDLL